MQGTLQEKQQYLREEILEKGYDAEQFIAFMHEKNGQNINISQLPILQLKSLVFEYKQYSDNQNNSYTQPSHKNVEEDIRQQPQQNIKQQQIKVPAEKKNKILYERYNPLFDFQLTAEINCVQSQRLINVQNLQISIPDFETKQTQGFLFGIGSRTQYYFHIKTNLMNGTVKRVSEDFDWLSNTIGKLYPFLALPQLQGVRKDIDDPYQKRKADIQEYLQHLAQKQYLLTSQLFIDFLTISHQKIQKYKKSYDSMGFARGASLLKNTRGKVQVQLSNNSMKFFKDSKQFTRKISTIHDKISSGITKVIDSYQNAIDETYTVVSYFAELHDTYNSLSNKFPLLKKQQYSDILVNLNNLFLGIGDSIQGIKNKIQKYGKEYFRFIGGFDKNLHKLQKTVKQSMNEYLDYKYNLYRKKQRVISDPGKWELEGKKLDPATLTKEQLKQSILPRETLVQNELRYWYGYNLKNYQIQFQDYLMCNTKRYAREYRKMCKELLTADKAYLQTLTNFIEETRKY